MSAAPTYQDRTTGRVYPGPTEMVNDYLERFGKVVGVDLGTLDDKGYTEVRRGSATVGINVLRDHGVLLLLSQVAEAPKGGRELFYRRLLELNFLATADAAFALDKGRDAVYVRALRGLSGLDYTEFEDLLNTVATVADDWDDKLKTEFAQ